MSFFKKRIITSKTSGTTLTLAEMGDILVSSASPLEIVLPTASGHPGLWYQFINGGAGTLTVDDGSTHTTVNTNTRCIFISDGSSWYHG